MTSLNENKPELHTYEAKLRLLGHEVFAIGFTSSSPSNRWVAIGLLTAFCTLTLIGAYGEMLINLFSGLI